MQAAEFLFTALAGVGTVLFLASVAEVEAAPGQRDAPVDVVAPSETDASAAVELPVVDDVVDDVVGEVVREAEDPAPVLGALEVSWPHMGEPLMVPLSDGPQELPLDLDQWPLGAELRVNVDEDRVDEIEVAFQYETSLTVGFEGPHWELLDFEHHTSSWQALERDGLGTWTIPDLTDQQRRSFPAVSEAQILDAMRNYLTDAGVHNLPDQPVCAGANEAPCAVDVSRIGLRVRALKGGRLLQERRVDLWVPMGC